MQEKKDYVAQGIMNKLEVRRFQVIQIYLCYCLVPFNKNNIIHYYIYVIMIRSFRNKQENKISNSLVIVFNLSRTGDTKTAEGNILNTGL